MVLSSILPQSCFATIATIKDEESLDKFELFSQYSKDIVEHFQNVIIATNSLPNTPASIIASYHNKCRDMAPNCVILHSEDNKGHMFGTIDLEESILTYIKSNLPEVKYLWKSMDDVIVTSQILNLEVEEAGFYYLPGFSYESTVKAGGKEKLYNIYEAYESGFWTPQTTFFILDIRDIDSLYGSDVAFKMDIYNEAKTRNPNIKPWELPFDIKFDCETHLGRTTKDLKKVCLLGDSFKDLLGFVESNQVPDPSHKNIYFEKLGICHYHFYKNLIYSV